MLIFPYGLNLIMVKEKPVTPFDKVQLVNMWKRKTKLKESSIGKYITDLHAFCRYYNITEHRLLEYPLEKIEEMTEDYIRVHEIRSDTSETKGKISPKTLNSTFCAIKKWLFINNIIKNTKLFKQIDFDKTSNKSSAIDQEVIEIMHLKRIFDTSDLGDKIDIGLYSLCALRPQMIHAIRVKDILPSYYEIKNNHIYIQKPTLVVGRRPNKGNFDFLIVLPTKLGEWIEASLNQRIDDGKITDIKEARLANCKYRGQRCDMKDLRYTTRKVFKRINLSASPYTLRSLGDTILERLTYVHNDEDLKEFLMNHKGKISATYGLKGIHQSVERQNEVLRKYQCVDDWINENIFGAISDNDKKIAQILSTQAKALGVNENKIRNMMEIFSAGNMSVEDLQKSIASAINESYTLKIEDTVLRILKKRGVS